MLILARKEGEEIVINGNIRVVLVQVRGQQARIGIDAPPSVRVDRQEVHDRRRSEEGKEKPVPAARAG